MDSETYSEAAIAIPAIHAPSPTGEWFDLKTMLDANPMVGERKRHFWTTKEIKLIEEHYPTGGVAACLPRLPGRSANSIYQKANLLDLVAPATAESHKKGNTRQTWKDSPEIDAVLLRRIPEIRTREERKKLVRALNRPNWWISRRAAELGLVAPRFKEPQWSERELEIIGANPHLSLPIHQRHLKKAGFSRSPTAIKLKLKRLQLDRTDPNHYTARGLADMMGVDSKAVASWIAKGLLTAERRGTARTEANGGDQHWIHRKDVREFIVANVAIIDIRRVDKFWFVELLTGPYRDV